MSHTFWLQPGHTSEPGVWWAGTSPPGLFVSEDNGATWESVAGFNDHPMYDKWAPPDGGTPDGALLNQGVEANFLPDPYPEYGQDAHYIALAPNQPDRLWQQNHCGVYRLDRPELRWTRIGKAMPPEVGDIGFTIVPHPRDADTASARFSNSWALS